MVQFITQVATSIEQSQQLIELGVKPETADLVYCCTKSKTDSLEWNTLQSAYQSALYKSPILPAFRNRQAYIPHRLTDQKSASAPRLPQRNHPLSLTPTYLFSYYLDGLPDHCIRDNIFRSPDTT